jgi:hypothetical protein
LTETVFSTAKPVIAIGTNRLNRFKKPPKRARPRYRRFGRAWQPLQPKKRSKLHYQARQRLS